MPRRRKRRGEMGYMEREYARAKDRSRRRFGTSRFASCSVIVIATLALPLVCGWMWLYLARYWERDP